MEYLRDGPEYNKLVLYLGTSLAEGEVKNEWINEEECDPHKMELTEEGRIDIRITENRLRYIRRHHHHQHRDDHKKRLIVLLRAQVKAMFGHNSNKNRKRCRECELEDMYSYTESLGKKVSVRAGIKEVEEIRFYTKGTYDRNGESEAKRYISIDSPLEERRHR